MLHVHVMKREEVTPQEECWILMKMDIFIYLDVLDCAKEYSSKKVVSAKLRADRQLWMKIYVISTPYSWEKDMPDRMITWRYAIKTASSTSLQTITP